MPAELKILADVASFRLRRLEMANLAGAAALGLVLAVPAGELALRLGFGALLNLLVYLNNDFHDREADLVAGGRERDKTAYLVAHRGAAVRAQIGLMLVLAAWALAQGGGLWIPLVVGGGVCWAYSAVLKRRPFVDVAAMMVWGASMSMVGVPLDRVGAALPLLVLLALFSGVFETVQVLRDVAHDRGRGLRTTAVALGADRCGTLARGLAGAAALYAWIACSGAVALPLFVAGALPVRGVAPARVWTRMRLLCGASFVLACAAVWRGAR